MLSSSDVTKEGFLTKQSRYLKVWRQRWTVLRPDEQEHSQYVSTYKKERVYVSPTEAIRVGDDTEIEIHDEDNHHRTFYIENKKDREKFLFRAASTNERNEWIESIKQSHARVKHAIFISNGDAVREEIVSNGDTTHGNYDPQRQPQSTAAEEVKEEEVVVEEEVEQQQQSARVLVAEIAENVEPQTATTATKDSAPAVATEPPPNKPEDEERASHDDDDGDDETEERQPQVTAEEEDGDNQQKGDAQQPQQAQETTEVQDADNREAEEQENAADEVNVEEVEEVEEEDGNGNSEAEQYDAVGAMPFETLAPDSAAMMNLTADKSDKEETASIGSSTLRSDGDGPFGNRWDGVFEDESKSEHNAEDGARADADTSNAKPALIDTSDMAYCTALVCGVDESGQQLLWSQLGKHAQSLMVDDEDEKAQSTPRDMMHCVFIDDEKDADKNICCSFMNARRVDDALMSYIALSDVAVLVVSAKSDDFDAVRNLSRILNTVGVERIICAVSGMDEVAYDASAFESAREKVEKVLTKNGLKKKNIVCVPMDGAGANMAHAAAAASSNDDWSWYQGWTLKTKKEKTTGFTVVDALRGLMAQNKSKKNGNGAEHKAAILPISSVNTQQTTSSVTVSGKLEQGTLGRADKIRLVSAAASTADTISSSVQNIQRGSQAMDRVSCGDLVSLEIASPAVPPRIGDVIYAPANGDDDGDDLIIKPCKSITAMVEVRTDENLAVATFTGSLYVRSAKVECTLQKIHWKKGTKKEDKKIKDGKFLCDKEQGSVELVLNSPIIATPFEHNQSLGRFVVLDQNAQAVIVGKIKSVSD